MTMSRRGRRGGMVSRIACPRSFRTPVVPGAAAWPRPSGTFLKGRQTRWSAASSRGRAWEPGFKRRLRVLGNPGRKGGLGRPLGQQERARERSRWPPRRVRARSRHGARRAPDAGSHRAGGARRTRPAGSPRFRRGFRAVTGPRTGAEAAGAGGTPHPVFCP